MHNNKSMKPLSTTVMMVRVVSINQHIWLVELLFSHKFSGLLAPRKKDRHDERVMVLISDSANG